MALRGVGLLASCAVVFAIGGATIAACTGEDPDGTPLQPDASTPTPTNPTPTVPPGVANGVACTTAGACASNHCVDGVCCESACEGVCERCNEPNARGTCAPVGSGQDPDNECGALLPVPPIDAGSDPGDAGDAGAAPSLLLPDGGIPVGEERACAAACDGNRRCAFPTTETSCGPKFCTTPTTQGAARCNGAGRCLYGSEDCTTGACVDANAGCATSCTQATDCLPGHYCDGTSCRPTLGLGVACTGSAQCSSGVCATGVCCETACNGTCNASGQCICPECSTGPCALFYEDKDGDGFGDKDATVLNNRAKYACADKPLNKDSKNNRDCYDGPEAPTPMDPDAKNVRPGASFQTKPFHIGVNPTDLWDWDCSGTVQKRYLETGAACLSCSFEPRAGRCIGSKFTTKCGKDEVLSHACLDRARPSFGSCEPDPKALESFASAVACGAASTLYTCGRCFGGDYLEAKTETIAQGCR